MFKKKWEYKLKRFEPYNIGEGTNLEIVSNSMGKDGWELVSVIIDPTNNNFRECYFKRPK